MLELVIPLQATTVGIIYFSFLLAFLSFSERTLWGGRMSHDEASLASAARTYI
jgi:hypothetical protein